ncbi:hypothetical protein G7Y89_g15340 [Cudoniella acicularis]|uniref:Zn(2)-C6 fungal-type domain-containing protein n=1 Tax=Cudoniella acicularis TaxID=354080 RepID=A0A8H4VKQ9_9HELO|nr:hypothetical protein G7Y89_g15340 [Cudoniella acicularis]
MPCGSLDKRRQGHRCVQCRENHRKCDGSRPCRYCKDQKLKCDEPVSTKGTVTVVQYRPNPPIQPISRILGVNDWLFVRIFFNAVISDSLFLSAYTYDEIGQLIHEKGSVYEAVVAVGTTYASQMYTDLRLSSDQKKDLDKLCSKLRFSITSEIHEPHAIQDPYFLLRAHLLGFIEIMTDDTAERWGRLVHNIQHYLLPQNELAPSEKSFHVPLLSTTRLSIAICDVMYDNLPCTLCLTHLPCNISVASGPQKEVLTSRGEKIEFLARVLERWAVLKFRSFDWIKNMESDQSSTLDQNSYFCLDQDTKQISLAGLEIICQACELQQEVIATMLNQFAQGSECAIHDRDFIQPFYHWVLTGLSHLFLRPEWHSYDWNLPVMEAALTNQQALLALNGVERMLQKAQIDTALYASFLPVVGVQLSTVEDRNRIIKLLHDIKERGFAVASAFEADIIRGWNNPHSLFF